MKVTLYVVLAVTVLAASGAAQDTSPASTPKPSATVGKYTKRALVLPPRTVRGDLLVSFDQFGASADFGVTFGVVENFELGVTRYRQGGTRHTGSFLRNPQRGSGLLPLLFTPDDGTLVGDFGDLSVAGRYRFLNRRKFELGVDFGIIIPTNTHFGFWVSLPARARFGPSVSLDFGVEFSGNLRQNDGAVFDFRLPLELNGNLSEVVYIGLSTSIGISTSGGLHVPLAAHVGFSGSLGPRSVQSDFELEFGFPSLFNANDDRSFISSAWMFGVNYRIHYGF